VTTVLIFIIIISLIFILPFKHASLNNTIYFFFLLFELYMNRISLRYCILQLYILAPIQQKVNGRKHTLSHLKLMTINLQWASISSQQPYHIFLFHSSSYTLVYYVLLFFSIFYYWNVVDLQYCVISDIQQSDSVLLFRLFFITE